jgi:hypothetical protein
MFMKKILTLTLVAVLLAGCGAAASTATGLGHSVSIAKSKDATADVAGVAQVDTVMAAVTFDGAGKILGVKIDSAQTKVNFDATGKITSDLAAPQKTKVELGNDYGMKKNSNIGREWFEQIAELEKWMVGKTVDQVKTMKVKDGGAPDIADLNSKVTISVADYQAAVAEAYENSKK